MKKRVMAMVLCLILVCGIAGCGKDDGEDSEKKATPTVTTGETTPETTPEATPTNAVVVPEIAATANEFVKAMKLGWNLGNTLDATGGSGLKSETSWGQPETTKEIIDAVKAAGFTTIRIPTSWGKHVGDDGTIDAEWMARVKQIVDWALEDGMFVILNSHHDCDYYYPNEEHFDESVAYIENIWTQIAATFKDYDEHLVFESMNEPRLMNTSKEWWFSTNDPEGVASIQCIVKLNQKFVDVVRAAGSYNETRFLMVPSHAASADTALNNAFTMPTDTIENHLIVSVHAYSPYDFAMNENGYSDWDASKENQLSFMSSLKSKFVDNGYGVVIGEMGCINKNNLESRVAWADSFTKLAVENGIACVWWDNSGTNVGSENFGLISRYSYELFFPTIMEAMLKNYNY